jgi:hypothetical protein
MITGNSIGTCYENQKENLSQCMPLVGWQVKLISQDLLVAPNCVVD